MDVRDKTILILGLAREGASLARFFSDKGARVVVTDTEPPAALSRMVEALDGRSIHFALGGDHPDLVKDADMFFVSPGVPEWSPVYQAAVQADLQIQSMTTLFFDICPGKIIGITGSSGKTTTTSLIGHILQTAGSNAVVGGNIGDPMLDLLPAIHPDTAVVLELSSFQLSLLHRSPHVALVTNITPNHLDRHGTMEDYVAAKRKIVAYQTSDDIAILNATNSLSAAFAESTPGATRWFALEDSISLGATVRNGSAGLKKHGSFIDILPVAEIPLLGKHNVENVLAALTVADVLDVEPETMANAVRTYRPVAHRLQIVGESCGVRYVDDSIATSPARAQVAIEAIESPILLIAGGRDKNLPWDDLARTIVHKVRALFLIGEAAPLIETAVRRQLSGEAGSLREDSVYHCSSLEKAVHAASRLSSPGDVVLLSPGCTSYDMFKNFEERGDLFIRAVEALRAA